MALDLVPRREVVPRFSFVGGLDLVEAEWPNSVVCVGTFDGVHLGHQAVIGKALDVAAHNECFIKAPLPV